MDADEFVPIRIVRSYGFGAHFNQKRAVEPGGWLLEGGRHRAGSNPLGVRNTGLAQRRTHKGLDDGLVGQGPIRRVRSPADRSNGLTRSTPAHRGRRCPSIHPNAARRIELQCRPRIAAVASELCRPARHRPEGRAGFRRGKEIQEFGTRQRCHAIRRSGIVLGTPSGSTAGRVRQGWNGTLSSRDGSIGCLGGEAGGLCGLLGTRRLDLRLHGC